ncbi:MAG: helix-turn-helix domain-containing protein [Prevotella sp.]|nr:helix-turn-helix domain-containing protein [Prevotella sp.]
MDNVGEKLKEYFDNQGITQKDIAEKLHVSKAYINALFSSRTKFGKKQAEKWSNEFGLSASWLLTGSGRMFADNSNIQIIEGNNNNTINGNGNILNTSCAEQSINDRIKTIINEFSPSVNAFAKTIKVPQSSIASMLTRRAEPSVKMINAILSAYPNINKLWLLTGEGDMLTNNGNIQIIDGNDNTTINSDAKNNFNTEEYKNMTIALNKAMDEISEQRKLISKRDEQIDRLLSIIEKQCKE